MRTSDASIICMVGTATLAVASALPARHRRRMLRSTGAGSARNVLQAMAMRSEWVGHRFVAPRTDVRMLPHVRDIESEQKVRQMAVSPSDLNPGSSRTR